MELYRLYLVVGGMPDAVRQYLETNNLQTVIRIQRDIINLYKRDISKYDSGNKLYIEEILASNSSGIKCQEQEVRSQEIK